MAAVCALTCMQVFERRWFKMSTSLPTGVKAFGYMIIDKTCELLMFLLYLPPNLTSLQKEQITKYILHKIDSLMTLTTARSLIICGDIYE